MLNKIIALISKAIERLVMVDKVVLSEYLENYMGSYYIGGVKTYPDTFMTKI